MSGITYMAHARAFGLETVSWNNNAEYGTGDEYVKTEKIRKRNNLVKKIGYLPLAGMGVGAIRIGKAFSTSNISLGRRVAHITRGLIEMSNLALLILPIIDLIVRLLSSKKTKKMTQKDIDTDNKIMNRSSLPPKDKEDNQVIEPSMKGPRSDNQVVESTEGPDEGFTTSDFNEEAKELTQEEIPQNEELLAQLARLKA